VGGECLEQVGYRDLPGKTIGLDLAVVAREHPSDAISGEELDRQAVPTLRPGRNQIAGRR
jgi:hypothetical protein